MYARSVMHYWTKPWTFSMKAIGLQKIAYLHNSARAIWHYQLLNENGNWLILLNTPTGCFTVKRSLSPTCYMHWAICKHIWSMHWKNIRLCSNWPPPRRKATKWQRYIENNYTHQQQKSKCGRSKINSEKFYCSIPRMIFVNCGRYWVISNYAKP